LGVEYPSYPCCQKAGILLFNSKWDTLSVLKIKNEQYFVSKNRGAAPLIAWINDFFFLLQRKGRVDFLSQKIISTIEKKGGREQILSNIEKTYCGSRAPLYTLQ
jgi:hypothetical protein